MSKARGLEEMMRMHCRSNRLSEFMCCLSDLAVDSRVWPAELKAALVDAGWTVPDAPTLRDTVVLVPPGVTDEEEEAGTAFLCSGCGCVCGSEWGGDGDTCDVCETWPDLTEEWT